MGALQAVAAVCSPHHGGGSGLNLLGPSGLAGDSEDYLYGDHLLPAGAGLYLCQYSQL